MSQADTETGAFTPLAAPPDRQARPRALLFDWDNTLVDTWPTIHASLADLFAAMGRTPWSLEEVKTQVRHSLRDSFPVLFGDRWEEARDLYYAAFERRHLAALTPLAGAEALVPGLAQAGFALGVVSNKTGRYLRREAEHLGWAEHFSALVGAGDAARDKPAVEAARHALALMDARAEPDPAAIWFVGDSNVDMEIARAAGFTAVLVRPDAGPDGEFEAHPPHLHLPDCAALQQLVMRL